jgi:hypothetical protein
MLLGVNLGEKVVKFSLTAVGKVAEGFLVIMTKITNWIQLRLSKPCKPVRCNYCDGKLLYYVYKVVVKLLYFKRPPLRAKDLNITRPKNKVYKKEYAICQKCNAKYNVKDDYYSGDKYGYNNSKSKYLEPVIDIDADIDAFISTISNMRYKTDKNISSYIVNKYIIEENEKLRFIEKFVFLIKLRNAINGLLNIKELHKKA